MKTAEGATTSGHVGLTLIMFLLLYIVLGWTSARVLRKKMFRNNTAEDELIAKGIEGGPAHV